MRHRHALTRVLCIFVIIVVLATMTSLISRTAKANGPLPFAETFDSFDASGFDPNPGAGQLDSDIWIVTGMSDGDMIFGNSQTGGDFARGLSTGGVGTGGVYAFDVGGGNIILGVQPGSEDFTPGDIILRLQNNTDIAITQLDIGYDIWVYNDQPRSNSLNFSYSTDNVTYTPVSLLNFSTPEPADAAPVWQSTPRSTILTGLNVSNGGFFYLKWTGDDVSGSGSRDEYGIDNVQVSIPAGDLAPFVAATTPVNGATGIAIDSNIEISFSEVVIVTSNAFALECPAGTAVDINLTPTPPGNADSFILAPTADLPFDTTCQATVNAAQVTDQNGTPMDADYTFTFEMAPPPPAPADTIFISEFLYDGLTPSSEGDEFIEICNSTATPIDLTGHKVGDEETNGGGEGMYLLPDGTILAPNGCLVIAKNAADFQARFGLPPDLDISALSKHSGWSSGNWSLANTGDELLLLGPSDEVIDSVAFRNGDYAALGLEGPATAPEPHSLQRVWPIDTQSMPHDFVRTDPTPGVPTAPPSAPALPPAPATLPGGMYAYWGHLHAHTTYSDGAGPPYYALAVARNAGLHYYGITDHGWWLDSTEWTKILTQTTAATVPGQFVALRGVEWSHDGAGHINIFNINTLLQRTDPRFAELSDFYTWLAANPDVVAQFNHPDPSYGGTFNNFALHPAASQVMFMQEIGNNAQIYTTYEPSFIQSNTIGWRTAPTNNGDTHNAQWGTDTPARTGIVAPALTEADLLDAMRARRVFASEDSNLALTLRGNGAWMGTVLTTTGTVTLTVNVVDPDPEPITLNIYDGSLLLESVALPTSTDERRTTVETLPGHFYWVKAIQADGDAAYSAPLWIEGTLPIDTIFINEILPSPREVDWDGDGLADSNDEWIELYNPLDRPVGLGGWQLSDGSNVTYNIPLGVSIPAGGYVIIYKAQSGIALNNGGDTLTLKDPLSRLVDSMNYDHSPGYDEGWCRIPTGGSHWSDDCDPTPGVSNIERPDFSAEPLKVKIFDAKRLTLDAWVVVNGRVTVPPGILGYRTMYIQDDTAGIKVYLPRNHGLHFNLGDKVQVEGNLDIFREEFEIEVDDPDDASFKEIGLPPPPLPIATTSLLEPYEGMLVMLQGQAVHFQGRTTFWVDDGTDWAKVVVQQSTGIHKPFIERGTPVTVVGVVSQYSDPDSPSRNDYRLLLRYQTDLVLPAAAPVPIPSDWPILLPETGN